jgi:predicted adenine nucleotide alpha hydrolase (AANH) superfamily ATPase
MSGRWDMSENARPRLLLHACCAPCSTTVLERLASEYEITGYYYNPNIHPSTEYLARLVEAQVYYNLQGIQLIAEEYDEERWHDLVVGHESDPERGKRCTICYRMRLEKTARKARELGMDFFGTVLTISPHKDAGRINALGEELGERYGVRFLTADFKKKEGYKRSLEISKEKGLYRQDYCGCIYSRKKHTDHHTGE